MTYTLKQLDEKKDKFGNLYLRDCTGLTSLPDNLTANTLYLGGCTGLTSLPDNLTTNNLDLGGCTGLTSLPDNLTVNNLYLGGCTGLTGSRKSRTLRNGDYVSRCYLYADGILTHVKRTKQIGKYTYYAGKIKGYNVIYDGVNYAHCEDFVSGVSDLAFKAAKNRGAEQYKGLTKDSVVSLEDGRTMYRVITGACAAGTKQFVDGMGEIKDRYTIGEIIEMTQNAYGGEIFRKFFEED